MGSRGGVGSVACATTPQTEERQSSDGRPPTRLVGDGSGRLVGRDTEINHVVDLLGRGGRQPPRILVEGERGVGKSAFVAAAGRVVEQERGESVVFAQGRAATREVPAGAFLNVLPTAPPASDTASVLWWLRNTLSTLADVVVLDDAHLVDDISLSVCDGLASSGSAAVLLAATPNVPNSAALGELIDLRSCEVIDLPRMDCSATAELVSSLEGAEVGERAVADIHDLTGGLPLAVCEVVRAARNAGSPVSSSRWRWRADFAESPELRSLFRYRLADAPADVAGLVRLVAAINQPLPLRAAELSVASRAVSDAVNLGLLVEREGCLSWPYALLGEIAATTFTEGEQRAVRTELAEQVTTTALDSLEIVGLAAQLDLERVDVDADLQVAAARVLLDNGMVMEAETHARAASAVRPADHEAALIGAITGIVAQRADVQGRARDALRSAPEPHDLVEAARACAHRHFSTHGDLAAAHGVIDDASALATDEATRSRIDFIRLQIGIGSMSPHEFVDAATRFLSSGQATERERVST